MDYFSAMLTKTSGVLEYHKSPQLPTTANPIFVHTLPILHRHAVMHFPVSKFSFSNRILNFSLFSAKGEKVASLLKQLDGHQTEEFVTQYLHGWLLQIVQGTQPCNSSKEKYFFSYQDIQATCTYNTLEEVQDQKYTKLYITSGSTNSLL